MTNLKQQQGEAAADLIVQAARARLPRRRVGPLLRARRPDPVRGPVRVHGQSDPRPIRQRKADGLDAPRVVKNATMQAEVEGHRGVRGWASLHQPLRCADGSARCPVPRCHAPRRGRDGQDRGQALAGQAPVWPPLQSRVRRLVSQARRHRAHGLWETPGHPQQAERNRPPDRGRRCLPPPGRWPSGTSRATRPLPCDRRSGGDRLRTIHGLRVR